MSRRGAIPVSAQASGSSLLAMSRDDLEFNIEVGIAITSIGKNHSVADLLSIEMPAAILIRVLELCAESRFAAISQTALLALFNHKSEGVRKATALMAVRSLTVKRIRDTLRKYLLGDNYRYYNVIHWLDLGASMRRNDAKKVARTAAN